MPHSYLRLRFQDDHDGTGKLLARAEAAGFAGESGAYFNISEIEEFAAAIAVFPVPENESYSICGGFGKRDGSGELEQEHLGIEVYPLDSRRGYLGMQVRMATELWTPAKPESQRAARVEVVTSYEPLSKFSRDLIAVVRGSVQEAWLVGETL
jgi:hypothetical protein